jgi:hypothetical protein
MGAATTVSLGGLINGGTFTLTSGTVEFATGGFTSNSLSGTFQMYGGSLTSSSTLANPGALDVYGCNLSLGGLTDSGTFLLTGGTVEFTSAGFTSIGTGTNDSATFQMYGGSLTSSVRWTLV